MASYPPIGSRGEGGIGTVPFDTREADSLTAVFTSIANRDTYYSNNADEISLISDLGSQRRSVGIGPTDGDATGVTIAFIRNDDNTDWIPIPAYQGPRGEEVDLSALANNDIPIKDPITTRLGASGVTAPNIGELRAAKSVFTAADGLSLGNSFSLSAFGYSLAIYDSFLSRASVLVQSRFSETSGTSKPFLRNLGPEFNINIQDVETDTITTNPLTFDATVDVPENTFTVIDRIILRTDQPMTNVSIRITDVTDGHIKALIPTDLDAFNKGVGGIDLIAGENTINISRIRPTSTPGTHNIGFTPFELRRHRDTQFEIKADNVSLKGNSADFPYIQLNGHEGNENDIPIIITPITDRRYPYYSAAEGELVEGSIQENTDNVQVVDKPLRIGTSVELFDDREAVGLHDVIAGTTVRLATRTSKSVILTDGQEFENEDGGLRIFSALDTVSSATLPSVIDTADTPPKSIADGWFIDVFNEGGSSVVINVNNDFGGAFEGTNIIASGTARRCVWNSEHRTTNQRWGLERISLDELGGANPNPSADSKIYPGVVGEVGLIEGGIITQKHLTSGVNEVAATYFLSKNDSNNNSFVEGFIKGTPSQVVGAANTVAINDVVGVALGPDTDAVLPVDTIVYINLNTATNRFELSAKLENTYCVAGKVLESIGVISNQNFYSVHVNMANVNQTWRKMQIDQPITISGTTQLFANRDVTIDLTSGNITVNMPENPLENDFVQLRQIANIGANVLTLTDTENGGFREQARDGTNRDNAVLTLSTNVRFHFEFLGTRWWVTQD